jgi:NADH-quinone oxidoreductase subunit C
VNIIEIFNLLKNEFGDAIIEVKQEAVQPWILVAPDHIRPVCLFLRENEKTKFDYLSCLSGMDYTAGFMGTVYHIESLHFRHKAILKTRCSKEKPHIQSVSSVWGCADWHEREAFDLFGIIYDGHPNLQRILLPEDWVGHPLRKSYKVQEFYHGIKVPS